jgi:hypothetical protein
MSRENSFAPAWLEVRVSMSVENFILIHVISSKKSLEAGKLSMAQHLTTSSMAGLSFQVFWAPS